MGRNAVDILGEHGVEITEDELAHFGVKGMRWGKRKKQSSSSESEPAKPHVKNMSDDELRSAINRLKMEQEYTKLTAPQVSAGKKIVLDILKDIGKQQAKNYINKELEKLITGSGKPSLAKAAAPAAVKSTRQMVKLVGQK